MFATFCRRCIGHTHEVQYLDRRLVQRETDPKRSAKEFHRAMGQFFEDRFDPTVGAARLCGYLFMVEPGRDGRYLISADPQDRLLGTKSYRAMKLRELERKGPGEA